MRPMSRRRRSRSSRRRRGQASGPDRDHHHRDQARGESAERADQRPGDRHAAARPAEHLELRGIHQAAAVGQLPDRRSRASRRSTCAASRPAATATTPGSLPSVGSYLDEQPVTTIGGTLDVHIYDIARIESLAGPQGTLYGASSEAGTIRIITNKPELGVTTGRVDAELNTRRAWRHGRQARRHDQPADRDAHRVPRERFLPARCRLHRQRLRRVADLLRRPDPRPNGRGQSAASTTASTSTMPISSRRISTTTTIYGGRAALKIDLDDNWTVTPTIMHQKSKAQRRLLHEMRRSATCRPQRFRKEPTQGQVTGNMR